MITFEQMLEAVDHAPIQGLDTVAFTPGDVVNIIMQRSEIINDQRRPGKTVEAWTQGDVGPAMALVDRMGDTLIRRAAAIIWLEYQEIKPALQELARRPSSVADIGCGYAIFDLFFWRDFPGRLVLIDLEESGSRHFGYREQGAAYSNLDVARRFLASNGVPVADITCCNPGTNTLDEIAPVDVAVSFISCGFHYPWETYESFFQNQVAEGGTIILDLRRRKAKAERKDLQRIGAVSDLTDAANGNAARLIIQKC
jgi:hypothetical protein